MPRLFPIRPRSDAPGSERRVFDQLARQLPEDWVVFHGVKRLWYHDGKPADGEVDFILAHPDLGVLVLEVKGGGVRYDPGRAEFVSEDHEGVVHRIGDPFEQANTNKHWLIKYMRDQEGWPQATVCLAHAVALPDVVVGPDDLRPNGPRVLTLDRTDLDHLPERLAEIFAHFRTGTCTPSPAGIKALIRHLGQGGHIRNVLLAEDVRAVETALLQLTEDQAEVLEGLSGNRRLLVRGPAGSGKTMLAIEQARRLSVELGLKVLFVCYNEALATHVSSELGYEREFNVFSYYRLAQYWGKKAGFDIPPYSPELGEDFYDNGLPARLLETIDRVGPQYDAIVVDEFQDFPPKWWESLFWLLHEPETGILSAFGDDRQCIFPGRTPMDTPAGFVPYQLSSNCRNARPIGELVARLAGERHRLRGIPGPAVEIIRYGSTARQIELLGRRLRELAQDQQVQIADIAVITPRHSPRMTSLPGPGSELLTIQVGGYQLTGNYRPKEGEVFARSIYSFKGLQRPVVIVAEVDDQIPDDRLVRLLYVIASRATTQLTILVSDQASSAVKSLLGLDS